MVVAIILTTLTLRTTKDRRTHIRPVLSFDMERSQIATTTVTNQPICDYIFQRTEIPFS